MNLLQETIELLETNGKSIEDIKWVGSYEYEITLDDFLRLADFEYYTGYKGGGNEVANDLLVVGVDWWLERWEFDGSEGWTYKERIERPKTKINVTCLMASQSTSRNFWPNLRELNNLK